MDPSVAAATFFLVFTSMFSYPFVIIAQSPTSTTVSKISVVGVVYCDSCSSSSFSKQSYFLPGAEVHIQCRFRATSPKTTEQISFTVNRTTDQHGIYKLDIPSVDGINCVDGSAIVSMCQATLISSTSPNCNVPFLKSTSSEISMKSRQENLCVYSLSALSYKPSHKNTTLCGQNRKETSLDSSKFYYSPYLPPNGFIWQHLPKLSFPPLPSIPFSSIPTLPFPPFPFQIPPSLPFPIPQIPPYPSSTPSYGVSPPFNLEDPKTWGTHVPSLSNASPPSPSFNLGNPTTWIPHVSSPLSPNIPQNQNP